MEALTKVQVEVRNVSFAYGRTQVLREVSLTVEPGEFFALLGPSGSGKSTLLRLIAGFNQPQSGSILIDGEDVSRVPPWKRDIGMVFQNYALWPHMTVRENVAFGLEERRLPKEAIRARVEGALELVGLQDYGLRRPGQLSGGQQQRVAVARTIAIEPKVLLLDEPLSNLDAKLRVYMRAELLALQRKLGITTIFVTHDQEEALSISDRVAVLDGGMVQQIGTPIELYDSPVNRFIANFVGTINMVRGRAMPGNGRVTFESPAIGRIVVPGAAGEGEGEAELAIRPHAVVLVRPGAEIDSLHTWVEGTVGAREFLGEFVRYVIEVKGAEITADEPHFSDHVTYKPGDSVRVGIDPARVKLFPA